MAGFQPVAEDSAADTVTDLVDLEDWRRRNAIARAWAAYDGRAPSSLITPLFGPDDNVQINLPRLVVDKSVDFLYGKPIRHVVEGDDDGQKKAQAALDSYWHPRTGRRLALANMGVNGGYAGHEWVKLREVPNGLPRLIVVDPADMTATWDQEDLERVLEFTQQWTATDKDGNAFARRQRTVRVGDGPVATSWEIIDEKSTSKGGWREIGRVTWPRPWPPIFHAQNLPAPNEFYGRPDLTDDVLDLSQAINATISKIRRILRFHAHPIPWASGVSAKEIEQLDAAVGRLLALPKAGAEVHLTEMQSEMRGPLELYRALKEAFHQETQTPEIATGKLDSVGQLSGLAMQILYGPLLDKTETKRETRGPLLSALDRGVLELMGMGDHEVTVAWSDPLPDDPKAEGEVLQQDDDLGIVSKETMAEARGYDWEREQKRMQDEGASLGDAVVHQFNRGGADNPANQPSD